MPPLPCSYRQIKTLLRHVLTVYNHSGRPPEFMEQAMTEKVVGYTANGVTYVHFSRALTTTWTESPPYGTAKAPPSKSNVVKFTAPGKITS